MEITGLPLHPLVVHAVVIFAPVTALVALVYAAVPRWRWVLRWPLVVLTVLAMGAVYVATLTGADLLESRSLGGLPGIDTHRQRGELLRNVMVAFTVVALLASFRLGGPTPLPSGRGGRDKHGGAVDLVLTLVLPVAALAVLVTAFLAGDSGARVLWG